MSPLPQPPLRSVGCAVVGDLSFLIRSVAPYEWRVLPFPSVLLSVLRLEDITQRMPREEAAEIEKLVTEVAQRICPGVICQASFRHRLWIV